MSAETPADATGERLCYRIPEFADAVGISRARGYEAVARGEVPTVEIGGCKRVPVSFVKTLIAEQIEKWRSR